MSIAVLRNLLLSLSMLAFAAAASAAPLNVSISDPPGQPIFIGYETALLPIHIEPTITGGTVNNLSGEIQPLLVGGFQLVGHDCPGSITPVGSAFDWSGIGDLVGGASIDCTVELRPTVPSASLVTVRLAMACSGCSNDADDKDTAQMEIALAPDVAASISMNPNPPVGNASLTVVLRNNGDARAHDLNVSLYGTASLFSTMTQTGVGKCITGTTTGPDEVSWEVAFLDPGEQINCPFTFTIPAAGSYALNILAPSYTDSGVIEPDLSDNNQSLTLNATSLVVNTRYSFYADANPGDGICADTNNGACSLRAAVEEANALAGYQTISVPYRADGYYLSGLTGYLTITDPVRISGVPDAATGSYPIITRDGSQNTGIIRINTASPVQTKLEFLDLVGNTGHQVSVDGAVVQQSSGSLWINESRVRGGSTTGTGGGIYGGEVLRLSGVEISDNVASLGAGLALAGVWNNGVKDGILEGVAFHDNAAEDIGAGGGSAGGAWFINADVSIKRSSFVDNTAESSGGGLMVATNSAVVITNSTISANTADVRGGGIYHAGGELALNFSTIAHNLAGPGDNTVGDGGGIWTSSTTVGNTDIRNSILAFNYARTSNGAPLGVVVSGNCHGVLDSQGYNTISFIDGDSDCSSTGSSNLDSNNGFPSLAPLQTTAGGIGYHRLTKVNHEIDQAAPACNDVFGSVNSEDLLRIPRPREGDGMGEALCDRGAVESVPVELHISTGESGPAAWQILVDGGRPACLDPQCDYYFIPVGSQLTLTADPSAGTSFDGWGGDCTGTGDCVLQMSEERNVSASFSATGFALNVATSGAGSVTSSPAGISCGADCTEAYVAGTEVTLTPSPDPGNSFDHWSGDCSGNGACVVQIDQARSVTAHFVVNAADIFANGFE